MARSGRLYRSILIAIDLDAPGSWERALAQAAELARSGGARLTLATVMTAEEMRGGQWSPAACRERIDVARARLAGLADGCAGLDPDLAVGSGRPAAAILDLARAADADLIVLASHRPGLRDYLIGGNAAHVVRHASCSVLVVRE